METEMLKTRDEQHEEQNDDDTVADECPSIRLDAGEGWLQFHNLESLQTELLGELVDADLELCEMEDGNGGVASDCAGFHGDPTYAVMVLNALLIDRGIKYMLTRYGREEYFEWLITPPRAEDATETAAHANAPPEKVPLAPATLIPAKPSVREWPDITIRTDLTGFLLETVLCLDQWLFVCLDANGIKIQRLPRPNKPWGRMRPVAYHLIGDFAVIRDSITRWVLQSEWPFMFFSGPADRADWTLTLPACEVRCQYGCDLKVWNP